MIKLRKLLRVLKDRSGATAIEYGLIACVICVAIVAGVSAVGQSTNDSFVKVKEKVWGP